MVKVTIKGEVFPFEHSYSLAEAIALEENLGMNFAAWDQAMGSGSAKAVAGYVWLVLRRNGRDVPLADILSGKYELSFSDVTIEDEDAPEPPGPTLPSSPLTGTDTSESSPRSSDTTPATSSDSPPDSSTT